MTTEYNDGIDDSRELESRAGRFLGYRWNNGAMMRLVYNTHLEMDFAW